MTRLEIYINGELADIIEEEIRLRINQTLWQPNKTATKQLEWSFSFNLPATPNNNRILQNANILAVNGKYHQRYKAEVYSDGVLVYDGSMILNSYNGQSKEYNCNLVNIKVNTLEDIFGDAVMTDAVWNVPYSGVPTLNDVNYDETKRYYFPMVCYGAFQKNPVSTDEVGNTYTSKYSLDSTNKWWHESFYPSMSVLETMRKLFQWKGYTVGGNAFTDDILTDIYASTNLAKEQSPTYNVGSDLFGDIDLTATFDTTGKVSAMNLQELNYKYAKVPKIKNVDTESVRLNKTADDSDFDYNFDEVAWWNLLDSRVSTVSLTHKQYIYDPNEFMIVAPADGWYTIKLDCTARLQSPSQSFAADQHIRDYTKSADDQDDWTNITITKDISEATPIEIQLIKNYDDNIELIKGRNNIYYANGNPNDTTYNYAAGTRRWRAGGYPNKVEWQTCYPHENLYGSDNPTNHNELYLSATKQMAAISRAANSAFSGNGGREATFGDGTTTTTMTTQRQQGEQIRGYVYADRTQTHVFDPAVSEAFICGVSSFGEGVASVQKNGKSWSPLGTTTNKCIANVKGYNKVATDGTATPTSLNYNTYNTAGNTNYATVINGATQELHGNVQCCVYLKKNDLLEIALVQRAYDSTQKYSFSGNVHLHMRAFSDQTEAELRSDSTWNMYSASRFPKELNLFNFTNKETKITDWISNVCTAFNLQLITEGNNITIDSNKGIKKDNMDYAIDIDGRASSDDATTSRIDYARSMAVRYKTDTKEKGFENSVPQEWLNTDEWEKHGDSGYTVIQLADDSYVTDEVSTQTQFSYCWYDNFIWKEVDIDEHGHRTDSGWEVPVQMPIIIDSQYFIDGVLDDEAMKHDGYSLTQRFWFRQGMDENRAFVVTSDVNQEAIDLTFPTNEKYGVNLSYKAGEKSLLTEYQNCHPLLNSNYVDIDVYITPEEYKQLCGGAKVLFDSDMYYCAEIMAYDAAGYNPTTLKLVKKID